MKTHNDTSPIGHSNLTDKVYRRIRDAILDGVLTAGERLVCADIAERFGVSSTPVRESLVRLRREGFIRTFPRKGTYVNSFSEKDWKEIYDIREVLEGLAARMAAISQDPESIKKMRQACLEYELGIKRREVGSCIDSDLRFHKVLAQASASRRLNEILASFSLQTISIAKKGINYWTYAPAYLSEHCTILELISQGKATLAEEKTREHIRKGKERITI